MPRFYRFDGSTGMDLRPAAVLEADAARMDELRRRRDSMAVTTRIRMVDQPPEGLLPLSLFGRTPLPDRTALHPRTMETVAPDLAGLYVDYMTRIAMGAPKRVAFRIPLLGARLVGQGEYAESLLSRMVDFAFPSARAACLLLDFDAASRRGPQYWRPRRMVPDAATYFNLTRMVARSRVFLDEYGPVVWEGFDFEGGYTDRIYSAPMSSSDSRVARMPAMSMRAMGTVCPVTAPNQHLVPSLIVFLLFRASMRGRSSPRRR